MNAKGSESAIRQALGMGARIRGKHVRPALKGTAVGSVCAGVRDFNKQVREEFAARGAKPSASDLAHGPRYAVIVATIRKQKPLYTGGKVETSGIFHIAGEPTDVQFQRRMRKYCADFGIDIVPTGNDADTFTLGGGTIGYSHCTLHGTPDAINKLIAQHPHWLQTWTNALDVAPPRAAVGSGTITPTTTKRIREERNERIQYREDIRLQKFVKPQDFAQTAKIAEQIGLPCEDMAQYLLVLDYFRNAKREQRIQHIRRKLRRPMRLLEDCARLNTNNRQVIEAKLMGWTGKDGTTVSEYSPAPIPERKPSEPEGSFCLILKNEKLTEIAKETARLADAELAEVKALRIPSGTISIVPDSIVGTESSEVREADIDGSHYFPTLFTYDDMGRKVAN